MDTIFVIGGTAEEIAALVKAGNGVDRENETAPTSKTKGRQDTDEAAGASDRELLIREYERRLALLKSGASTGDVIFQV